MIYMYNLRKIQGTLKGRVGETIFLSLNKYAHGTRFDSHYWMEKMSFKIPEKIKAFLIEYWSTIDAFEFIVSNNNVENIILYEIKTVNHYEKGINFGNKSTLTTNAAQCYSKAQENGFVVKSVSVILFDRWNFDVTTDDYKQEFYRIYDGNPRYSKYVHLFQRQR